MRLMPHGVNQTSAIFRDNLLVLTQPRPWRTIVYIQTQVIQQPRGRVAGSRRMHGLA